MSLAETILASLCASGSIIGLSIWLFKESIKTSLKLDMEERLNVQRADLDRVRDNLQFQFQQAILSIQLKTQKTHEIYPELFGKVKIAEGAIGRLLGGRESPTWQEHSIEDLRIVMARKNVVSGQVEKLARAIEEDREEGLKEMNKYLRMLEYNESKSILQEAKNYLILNSLYMTDEIADDCHEVCKQLWHAIVDANPEYVQWDSYQKKLEKCEELIDVMKSKMRIELTHKELNGSSQG